MSYTLQVRVRQSNPDWHTAVEHTIYGHSGTDGTWSRSGDEGTLVLDANCSGAVRFTLPSGAFVIFAVGILGDGVPWTDIATNLKKGDTGVNIHPTWYGDGSRAHTRDWENSRTTTVPDGVGRTVSVNVTGSGGAFVADIVFS